MLARVRRLLTFANVVSLLALFVALGGTSYAVTKLDPNSVRSKHIVNGQVRAPDLASEGVTSGKVAPGAIRSSKILDGEVRGPDIAANSVTGGKVADDSLKGADIDESTLAGVNAARLGGTEAKDFVRGPGETFFARRVIPMTGGLHFPGGVSGLFAVGTACYGAQYGTPVAITFDNQTNGAMDVMLDNGGANGTYNQLGPTTGGSFRWELQATQPTDVHVFHLSTAAGDSATVWVTTTLRQASSDCLVQVHAVARRA